MRLKFLTLLMLIVLAISLSVTMLRFGVGVLEDNFVAELSTNYKSSAQFMSFYSLLNFYLYTMAYVYSPAKSTVFGELTAGIKVS
jgi:Wnt-binding factor required for Wnt secretion.